jgi:thiol-disulfide isomerase/thioredoxin
MAVGFYNSSLTNYDNLSMRMPVCLFLFLAFLSGCRPAAAPLAVSNRPVSVGTKPETNLPLPPTKAVTEMTWMTDDNRVQRLSDMAGKAVVLDFWATYCPPCRQEIPHLNALIAKYGSDNLKVVGLNSGGEDDRAEIPKFLANTKLDYPIAYPEDELTRFVFAERDDIPQTLVFDRNGKLVTKIVGFSPEIQRQLDAAVEKAVNPGI